MTDKFESIKGVKEACGKTKDLDRLQGNVLEILYDYNKNEIINAEEYSQKEFQMTAWGRTPQNIIRFFVRRPMTMNQIRNMIRSTCKGYPERLDETEPEQTAYWYPCS